MNYWNSYMLPLYAYGTMLVGLLVFAVLVPEFVALVRRRKWFKGPRLWFLKRRARALYLAYDNAVDWLDCGETMAGNISPRLTRLRVRFDETMALIRALDPSAPPTKLSAGS